MKMVFLIVGSKQRQLIGPFLTIKAARDYAVFRIRPPNTWVIGRAQLPDYSGLPVPEPTKEQKDNFRTHINPRRG